MKTVHGIERYKSMQDCLPQSSNYVLAHGEQKPGVGIHDDTGRATAHGHALASYPP